MTQECPESTTVRAALGVAGRAQNPFGAAGWRWDPLPGGLGLRIADFQDETISATERPRLRLAGTRQRTTPQEHGEPAPDTAFLAAGAALHAAVLAFAAFGWQAAVREPRARGHLAALAFSPRAAEPSDIDRAAALVRCRADRRPYLGWALRPDQADALTAAAEAMGVTAVVVPARAALVPALGGGRSEGPGSLLVLSTPGATVADRLRAGAATSAVLLAATALGLSACALPQVRAAVGPVAPEVVVRAGAAA
ncbi:hypothetical protein [Actinokineospora fastidiosa]|uniref:Uncharacterized protein n=1 Tax=Actinokineospora fastidiosa TaxID=1816 RepID=A0A918GQQ9_9PSEU|nr:hypothetical protein [Actinokineospora fastidiosa]GGS55238.1 hypothetical protein GCM10010171_58060 [Actinokineospora fastidiosa]